MRTARRRQMSSLRRVGRKPRAHARPPIAVGHYGDTGGFVKDWDTPDRPIALEHYGDGRVCQGMKHPEPTYRLRTRYRPPHHSSSIRTPRPTLEAGTVACLSSSRDRFSATRPTLEPRNFEFRALSSAGNFVFPASSSGAGAGSRSRHGPTPEIWLVRVSPLVNRAHLRQQLLKVVIDAPKLRVMTFLLRPQCLLDLFVRPCAFGHALALLVHSRDR